MYYYFTASTKRLKEDTKRYRYITSVLNKNGCVGLNYVHFLKNDPKRIKIESEIREGKFTPYAVQTSLIDKSDFLVVNLIKETVTIGYQINYAVIKKIPVLVLIPEEYYERIPVMLTDDHSGLLTLQEYKSTEEIDRIIKKFLLSMKSGRIKFNFFINIAINNYLNQRSEKENKAKSELMREILQDEMHRNPV